jgi:hypothetical protein
MHSVTLRVFGCVLASVCASAGQGIVDNSVARQARTVGTVQLAHKVPAKAVKEFRKAVVAWDRKAWTAAIDHLRRGIAIDPTWAPAHNDLGLLHMYSANFAEAEREFYVGCHARSAHGGALLQPVLDLFQAEPV